MCVFGRPAMLALVPVSGPSCAAISRSTGSPGARTPIGRAAGGRACWNAAAAAARWSARRARSAGETRARSREFDDQCRLLDRRDEDRQRLVRPANLRVVAALDRGSRQRRRRRGRRRCPSAARRPRPRGALRRPVDTVRSDSNAYVDEQKILTAAPPRWLHSATALHYSQDTRCLSSTPPIRVRTSDDEVSAYLEIARKRAARRPRSPDPAPRPARSRRRHRFRVAVFDADRAADPRVPRLLRARAARRAVGGGREAAAARRRALAAARPASTTPARR